MTRMFEGRVVVIIGGNSGIGLAAGVAFANEGARVVITGRDRDSLDKAANQIGLETLVYRSDISQLQQIESLFAKLREDVGRIDVLFVNAGILAFEPIGSVTENTWDLVHSINVKGVFFCVQEALPLMRGGSAVVLTGSTAANKASPTAPAYAASKAALRSLGRSFASALVDRRIRVNVVSPGPTATPIYARAHGLDPSAVPAVRQSQIDAMPMRRMSKPEEVAAAVLFLASDSAEFITGVELLVDGGAVSF